MSTQIFKDIEEALAREVRRITFNDSSTVSRKILQDVFDPFTGELVSAPIEPSFYDSSVDANNIQYPNFYIRLIKTKEDRTSKRIVSYFGKPLVCPTKTSSKAYEIILSGSDGLVSAPGNTLQLSSLKIKKVLPNNLLRILNGNNKGTYVVDSTIVSPLGLHSILVKDILVSVPNTALFSISNRTLYLDSSIDLNTVAAGDLLEDSLAATFVINSVDLDSNSIELGGSGSPNISSGGLIKRVGNVLKNSDPSLVSFLVMDQTKPITIAGSVSGADSYVSYDFDIPLDAYYLIRIDSKERATHIDVLNRVWEEFNPPRTGLPVLQRSELSVEQLLKADVLSGGSPIITVEDNADFTIGEDIYIINDLHPTRNEFGEFETPFKSKIVGKISTNQLQLEDDVPDSFTIALNSRVVTNCELNLLMFHFVDHVTKDVETSQYFVHEFTFWVQLWIKKYGKSRESSSVTSTGIGIEDFDGDSYI